MLLGNKALHGAQPPANSIWWPRFTPRPPPGDGETRGADSRREGFHPQSHGQKAQGATYHEAKRCRPGDAETYTFA